jgi:hypothetical protein
MIKKIIGGIIVFLLVAAGVFYLTFLRGIPRPEIALQPIKFTGSEMPGQHDCMWMGPITYNSFNSAYPDEGAVYWPTVFKYPAGETGSYLEIKGNFPQARYMSMHSYVEGANPYDYLMDRKINPDEGATNPYRTGKFKPGQGYTLKVLPGERPADARENELYLGPMDKISSSPLILRIYVPETEGDVSGGAGLPKIAFVRANGERVEGEALCDLLQSPPVGSPDRFLAAPVIPRKAYDKMVQNREVRDQLFGAKDDKWTLFWDPRVSVLRLMSPALQSMFVTATRYGLVAKTSGFFANFDNQYVSMYLNENFGKVVVLEGKLPRTPLTGIESADTDAYDMRYWSLCTNEGLATTRYTDCVYDSNVVTDQDRNYKIVISKPANRPANATAECGVTWLDWGEKGDGAGNEILGVLILRNMAANPKFAHAVQNVPRVGDEKATMGDYLPLPDYMDKAAFEAKGCQQQ